MQKIRLRKASWEYDPSVTLGPPGGFGAVFLGRSEDGKEVAIKKLHISSSSVGTVNLLFLRNLKGKTCPTSYLSMTPVSMPRLWITL